VTMDNPAAKYPNTLLLINGQWREGVGGDPIPVADPATEETIGTVARAGRRDLEQAVEAASAAFLKWSEVPPYERSKIMRRAAEILRARRENIAWLLTREQGKTLVEARAEVTAAADIIEWFAEEGRRTYGRIIPSRAPNVSQTVIKLPVGPVAAFTPWNFPINQVVRKLSAALATGCSIIIKAPEETPASPAALVQAFSDAGLPDGVANLLYGVPSEISRFLISHPIVQKISFTGSTAVGKSLAALAGQYMKRTTMELGGHAPALVFDDADVDKAVDVLATAKFKNAGQICVSPTRIMVQDAVFEKFLGNFIELAKSIRTGNGLDPETRMGPLANERRVLALEGFVSNAVAQGAQLKAGGRRSANKGYFFEPTVLANVPMDADVMNVEPFGPLAIINPFDTRESAIAEANRLPYGLASYAFTRSAETAHEVSRRVQAGMTAINHSGLSLPEVPNAGIKDSGHGSEGGLEAMEPYLISKFTSHAV
jgi:succinate-semialdehyde dehydrogenase / glutarate-semialdehyde dehydrogenase